MVIKTARRIVAMLLALVLVFGPAVGGTYASLGGVKATVFTVSGYSHSPGNCDHCGASKGAAPAGMCSGAFCGGLAITPVAHFVPERSSVGETLSYKANYLTGRAPAPDPYPPRFIILS